MEYKDLILDMLNRIAKLEKEVELLKNEKKLFSEKIQNLYFIMYRFKKYITCK